MTCLSGLAPNRVTTAKSPHRLQRDKYVDIKKQVYIFVSSMEQDQVNNANFAIIFLIIHWSFRIVRVVLLVRVVEVLQDVQIVQVVQVVQAV